ncbi:hypothetical protein TWF281_011458 [Arthrobotrys megalospora]
MADLPSHITSKLNSITAFLALPESTTSKTDYLSLSSISTSDAEKIRDALVNDPILESLSARFTYDAEFQQIRITRPNAMINITAGWLQLQEQAWKKAGILPKVYENDITAFCGVETGYTQPATDLERDKEIWKTATNGETKVVILTKFSMTPRDTVMGVISFHRVNGEGGVGTCSKYSKKPATPFQLKTYGYMVEKLTSSRMPLYLYSEPDVTLIAGGRGIRVHEHVVAAQSDFFKAALRSGLKESHERRIELREIEPDILIIVLNWLYRAPIKSPLPNSQGIFWGLFSDPATKKMKATLRAFDFLQIKGAAGDHVKVFEGILGSLKSDDGFDPCRYGNIFIVLNEVYKAGCSLSEGAMSNLFKVILGSVRRRPFIEKLNEVLRDLQDPNGECFRDISLALATQFRILESNYPAGWD